MSWAPSHPGGVITCDAQACTRTRRYYCAPGERDRWGALQNGGWVVDLCPTHRADRQAGLP